MAIGTTKKKTCKCPLCKRHARIESICKKLPKADAKYLLMFEDYVVDCEAQEDMRETLKQQRN